MNSEEMRKVYFQKAIESYRKADTSKWLSALWASRVVGKYDRGATLGLADDMGVSTDTIEDMAHAYNIFEQLCVYEGGALRHFVFMARRAPYIHLSHFRALYDAKERYGLTVPQVMDLLMDVVQSEGSLSSRRIDEHTRSRYGTEKDWTWEAGQVMKKVNKLLQRPDFPKEGRKLAAELYNWIGDSL